MATEEAKDGTDISESSQDSVFMHILLSILALLLSHFPLRCFFFSNENAKLENMDINGT